MIKGYKILEMIDKGELEEGTILRHNNWKYIVRSNSIGKLSVYRCGFNDLTDSPPKGQITFISREMINKEFEINKKCSCEKGILRCGEIEFIEYIDCTRKVDVKEFNYCPICGRKLNE